MQMKLTENKTVKGEDHLIIMLKDMFSFAKHEGIAIHELGHMLTSKKDHDKTVVCRVARATGKIIKKDFSCYVPNRTPNKEQQTSLSRRNSSKAPTKLSHIQMSYFEGWMYSEKWLY